MSYEKIDDASAKDTFDDIVTRIFSYSKEVSPDIKERLELEKKLKMYLKAPKPDLVLNFILEILNYNE